MKLYVLASVLLVSACGSHAEHSYTMYDDPGYGVTPVTCWTPRTDADPPATVTVAVISDRGVVVISTEPLIPEEENRQVRERMAAEGIDLPPCDGGS